MSELMLVLQFAAAGVRANAWCNGFLVASSISQAPAVVRRRIEPFVVSGRNWLELELVDPGPPPPDAEDLPDLEASLHLVDTGAEPNQTNRIVSYAFSAPDLEETPAFQGVLRHAFGVGKVGRPRVWDRAANLLDADLASVLATGMADVRRALETFQGLPGLLELHAADHAAITEVSTGDALDDLGATLLAAVKTGAATATIAPQEQIVVRSQLDGRVAQSRTRDGRPVVQILHGEMSYGLCPAFGLIDGRVRVLRWS